MTLTPRLAELIGDALDQAGLRNGDIPTMLDEPTLLTALFINTGRKIKNQIVNRDPDPLERPRAAERRLSMLPAPANR